MSKWMRTFEVCAHGLASLLERRRIARDMARCLSVRLLLLLTMLHDAAVVSLRLRRLLAEVMAVMMIVMMLVLLVCAVVVRVVAVIVTHVDRRVLMQRLAVRRSPNRRSDGDSSRSRL